MATLEEGGLHQGWGLLLLASGRSSGVYRKHVLLIKLHSLELILLGARYRSSCEGKKILPRACGTETTKMILLLSQLLPITQKNVTSWHCYFSVSQKEFPGQCKWKPVAITTLTQQMISFTHLFDSPTAPFFKKQNPSSLLHKCS